MRKLSTHGKSWENYKHTVRTTTDKTKHTQKRAEKTSEKDQEKGRRQEGKMIICPFSQIFRNLRRFQGARESD